MTAQTDDEARWRTAPAWSATMWRTVAVAGLLAALTVTWAAFPLNTGKAGTRAALIVAVGCAVLAVAQLAAAAVPWLESISLGGLSERFAERLLRLLRSAQWPEGMLLAVLALEALHRSRPWHTAVLGVALIAFVFAVHLAETRARPRVLRPQLPLLAAGLGLLALAVGAAALPGLPAGPASTLIRTLSIVAAVLAGAIAVPASWGDGH